MILEISFVTLGRTSFMVLLLVLLNVVSREAMKKVITICQ